MFESHDNTVAALVGLDAYVFRPEADVLPVLATAQYCPCYFCCCLCCLRSCIKRMPVKVKQAAPTEIGAEAEHLDAVEDVGPEQLLGQLRIMETGDGRLVLEIEICQGVNCTLASSGSLQETMKALYSTRVNDTLL